jgi:hypothetical protein
MWEECEAKIHAAGEYMLQEYNCVIPGLRLAHERECLERVFAFAGLSWTNIDSMRTAKKLLGQWRLPGDAEFAMHPSSFVMLAKLLFFLTTPQQVEKSEVVSFLPLPEECKWLKDRIFDRMSQTEPLGVLIAKAATEVRDFNLAALHAQTALSYHVSVVKKMHAKHALSCLLVNGGSSRPRMPTTKPAVALHKKDVSLPSNAALEKLHRRVLELLNEGGIDELSQLIADDIEMISPMGKEYKGKEAVTGALVKMAGMVKSNFAVTAEGAIKCKTKTSGVSSTCARYTVQMMGMEMVVGDEIEWNEDGKVFKMLSKLNPTEPWG